MSDSLPPMTDETLAAIEARLGAATPGPWTAHMPGGIHDDAAWVGAPHEDEGNGVFVASTSGHPDGLNDAIFIASAPTDLRRLLDEVKRLRGELADFRQMAVLNSKAATETVDRARSECAALAAKLDAVRAIKPDPECTHEGDCLLWHHGRIYGWNSAVKVIESLLDAPGMPHTPAQAAPDSEMDPFEAADEMYRRWE